MADTREETEENNNIRKAEYAILGPPLRPSNAPRHVRTLLRAQNVRLIELLDSLLELEFISAADAQTVRECKTPEGRRELCQALSTALKRYDEYYVPPKLRDKSIW